ncbi:MAG: GntR family transcriptional regulator [Actinomycetes bacterium]
MREAVGVRLRPVARRSTVGLIAEQLREAIRDGTLAPGMQLREGELATQLGVSRGPLREAAQRLVAEGLLVSAWHRRLTVARLGPADVRDLYAARGAVEGAAWRAVLAGEDAAGAADRLAAAAHEAGGMDVAFHERLATESGSARLQRLLGTLLLESRLAADSTRPIGDPTARTRAHDAMVGALRDGDEERLLALNAEHMSEAVAGLGPKIRRDC